MRTRLFSHCALLFPALKPWFFRRIPLWMLLAVALPSWAQSPNIRFGGAQSTVPARGLNQPPLAGMAAFVEGGLTLGKVPVSNNGNAQLLIGTLGFGTHNVVAIYQGDGVNTDSTSAPVTVTVQGGVPAIVPGLITSYAGRYASSSQGSYSGDGGAAVLATLNAPLGVATDMAGNVFVPGTLTVAPAADTNSATSLAVSASSTTPGTVVTLVATVTQGGNAVTAGSVTFYNGNIALGTAQMVGANPAGGFATGTATLKLPFPVGSYSLLARFNGVGSTITPSVSGSSSLTVSGSYPTSTTFSAIADGNAFDLSATVLGAGAGAVSGTMNFADTISAPGNGSLSNVPLDISAGGIAILPATQYPLSSIDAGPADDDTTFIQPLLTADVNGDGIPDLVIVSTVEDTGGGELQSVLSVMLGNGDGTFQPRMKSVLPYINHPGTSLWVAQGDFNHDGVIDLIVSNYGDSSLTMLQGNGDGTFRALPPFTPGIWRRGDPNSLDTGYYPTAIAVGDYNRDGNLDLAVATGYGRVCVELGDGLGGFSASQVIRAGDWPSGIVTADLNGDGILDLAVTDTYLNEISILMGNGDGSFNAPQSFSTNGIPLSLAAGDLDNDGLPDLVVANDLHALVFRNNGDSTFSLSGSYPQAERLTLADVNGDGKLDLVSEVSGVNPNGDGGTLVSLLLNNGSGGFSSPVTYLFPTSGMTTNPVVSDLRGNGLGDIAVGIGWDTALSQYEVSVLLTAISQTAQVSALSLTPGSHTLQASYLPDQASKFSASNSNLVSISATAQKATASLSLSLSPAASPTYGTALSIAAAVAQVSGQPFATGLLRYQIDSGSTQQIALSSNGSAVIQPGTLAAGPHSVIVNYLGDANYAAATQQSLNLTVNPAVLTVTADNKSMSLGAPLPLMTATYSGFVNSETASVLAGAPLCSATAASSSPAGAYPITCTAGTLTAANYTFSFVAGTLTILPASSYLLTVTRSGSGTVTSSPSGINCGTTCSFNFDAASSVTLTATPASGAAFGGWSGCDAVAANTCTVAMNDVRRVSASFTVLAISTPAIASLQPALMAAGAQSFTLTVNGNGFASGAVVRWAGASLPTSFAGPTQLMASVPASDITAVGTTDIAVANLDGGVSPAFEFATDSTPSAVAPVSVTANTVTIQVSKGKNTTVPVGFTNVGASGARITARCVNLPAGASCSYDSATNLVTINTSSSTPAGSYQILVVFTVTPTSIAVAYREVWMVTLGGGISLPFGLLWLSQKGKKRCRWCYLALAGLFLGLLLAGCGSHKTAPAKAEPALQVSLPLTLTVN